MNRCVGRLAVLVSMTVLSAEASATTILFDDFNDGNLGTNTAGGGVGTGFTAQTFGGSNGAAATESGGVASVGRNGGFPAFIQSNDAINPTGTTMTWVVNSRLPDTDHTVAEFGWLKSGSQPQAGGDPQIRVELRTDRFQFFIGDTSLASISDGGSNGFGSYAWNGNSPVTATLYIDASNYNLSITGTGVNISASGPSTGFNTILTNSGGTMRAFADGGNSSGGHQGTGVYESVLITIEEVPEPNSCVLLALGSLGLVRITRRRK